MERDYCGACGRDRRGFNRRGIKPEAILPRLKQKIKVLERQFFDSAGTTAGSVSA